MEKQIESTNAPLGKKIFDILLYNRLVWELIDKGKCIRKAYLRTLIQAVLICGDIKNGYAVHKCEDCGYEHLVGFSCGKRFCNRCGYRRTENWVNKARTKVLQVGHRHIILTFPDILWSIFAYERDLLKLLPQVGHLVIQKWGLQKGIVKHGVISFIHTFGYDIKWNPHLHIIVTEGGLTASNQWKDWPWNRKKYNQPYISFPFLQTKWRDLFSKAFFSQLDKCWDDNGPLREYIFKLVLKLKKQQREEKLKPKKHRQRITLRHRPSRRDLKDLEQHVKEQQWYVNAESRLWIVWGIVWGRDCLGIVWGRTEQYCCL